MKKLLVIIMLLLSGGMIKSAEAVEVGDIYYHDKTFSPIVKIDGAKMPIGLVYWVYPSKDHGYIMALNQPVADTFVNALRYCGNYTTLNTRVGDWRLPDFQQMVVMGNEQWNGVKNNKFTVLNQKLATITGIGEALVAEWYNSNTTNSGGIQVFPSTGNQAWGGVVSANSVRFRCIMQF